MEEILPPQMVSNIISFENSNRSIPLVCQQLDEYIQNGRDLLQALGCNDDLDMLNQIVQAKNFGQSRFNQYSFDKCLIVASQRDYLQIVELLLTLGADPRYKENKAIRRASEYGHLDILNRLLQDERVNPSDDNNYAIRRASSNGYLAVVERLLQDERVDASDWRNDAIKQANANGHLAVVERLAR